MIRVRTGYSFRAAVGNLSDVTARLKEIEAPCGAMTDRASTFGFGRWEKICAKNELKPIYGVELAVTPSIHAKKPIVDFWTFIAKQDISAINRLVNLATRQFRYQPLLTYEQAMTECYGELFRIVGHRTFLKDISPQNDLFVALAPSVSFGFAREALARNFQFIACGDNKFPSRDDAALYEIICGRNASIQTYPQHILSAAEWRSSIEALRLPDATISASVSAVEATIAACDADLKTARLLKPKTTKTLREMCEDGAAARKIDLTNEIYSARLARELDIIATKQFEDYHFIIADIMKFARANMVCGPARGSSCGSLVCYLLGITAIDPIPFGLLFERYIDLNRSDWPDIDIDLSDNKRHLVFEFIEKTYGSENVARLGTVSLYRPRSALKEAGGALLINKWLIENVVGSLIETDEGDARALFSLEDTLKTTSAGKILLEKNPEILIAAKMEGHPRHASQHAAGIVITQDRVSDFVAIDARTGATMCDKKDAEDVYGFLKIDALGLTQLSVFEDCLESLKLPLNFLDSIALDDKAAFEIFNQCRYCGIFQFNGAALQNVARRVKIETLNDIVALTALVRPGPMDSGGTEQWIQRKNGREVVSYPHELFEPILKETLGVLTFQEQVMAISREVGGLSWEDVTALRRAIGKKLGGEVIAKFGEKVKAGAMVRGISAETIDKVWSDICFHGAYSFNKSHSVAYSIVSYWCAWLKARHPFEFAAATLSHEMDPTKQATLLREMALEGIGYVPVDSKLSTNKWTAGIRDGNRCLIGPLSGVRGFGPKAVADIMEARKRGTALSPRIEKLLSDAKTEIDSLWPIRDRISAICPDLSVRNIHTPPTPVAKILTNGDEYNVLAIGVFESIRPINENEKERIEKRGYEVRGPIDALNLWLTDDSDKIFAKVDRYKFDEIGRGIIERGRAKKAIYAVKGRVPKDFRMISIENVRYIGDMSEKESVK